MPETLTSHERKALRAKQEAETFSCHRNQIALSIIIAIGLAAAVFLVGAMVYGTATN